MAVKKGLGKGIFALFQDMEEDNGYLTEEDKELVAEQYLQHRGALRGGYFADAASTQR